LLIDEKKKKKKRKTTTTALNVHPPPASRWRVYGMEKILWYSGYSPSLGPARFQRSSIFTITGASLNE
jgi:hypothetical protein